MRFVNQNGFSVEVDPVCENLFRKRGWTLVIDKPIKNKTVEVAEETVEDSPVENDAANDEPKIYKKGDFTTMSKAEITELAESLGYFLAATKKAEMIEEFLKFQDQ